MKINAFISIWMKYKTSIGLKIMEYSQFEGFLFDQSFKFFIGPF